MPDPALAHARRGAEFTFDGPAFLALVKALRTVPPPPLQPVYAPSFDHAVKDPKPNDIAILPAHRIVVFEGNYVCLDKEPVCVLPQEFLCYSTLTGLSRE